MSDRLNFEHERAHWPHSNASRFVNAAGLSWHVQEMGDGPALLLLHGTGASTHSWRELAPLLAPDFRVVMIDLPGHGFTAMPSRGGGALTLPGMARAVSGLMQVLGVAPRMVAGHSAGAAVLVRMALDRLIAPRLIVSLNGALLPFRGAASQFFSPLAKMLVLNPLVPRLFAWSAASRGPVERLIRDTGSDIGADGINYYARLFRNPGHVGGALAMMANWDLGPLEREMEQLPVPLLLVVGSNDRAISPDDAFRVKALAPQAEVEVLLGLGHLAHEERPGLVAELLRRAALQHAVLPAP